jgi:hypothetical protein
MLTWGMFLGGFLATKVAIEFNSNSVASNKLPGVVNPWLTRYRMVWALKPQSARASSMMIDRLSKKTRKSKVPIGEEDEAPKVRQRRFSNLYGNGCCIVVLTVNHVTCQVF